MQDTPTEEGDSADEASDLVRVLDVDGSVVGELPDLSDDTLREMYRDMRFTRHFDERLVSLQRQGRIGTYSPAAGQEGAQIGSTYALSPDDWVFYQYREHGAVIARGMTPSYLRYWMGQEIGNGDLADSHIFPLNITIGDHLPHAVGVAWAAKLKGTDEVTLCHFGDGATSEGDFHEALNFAGVFDTPSIFFCNNNGWAISIPRDRQTASATIAQKATAYGFDGVRVDGMDPLAVYSVTRDAVERATATDSDEPRPTLIEAVTYRYGAHTTADDPTVYRDEAEVEAWKRKDPIDRLEAFLRETGRLDDEVVAAVDEEIRESVTELVEVAEAAEVDPEEMFVDAYAEMTPVVREQLADFRRLRERYGDESFLRE